MVTSGRRSAVTTISPGRLGRGRRRHCQEIPHDLFHGGAIGHHSGQRINSHLHLALRDLVRQRLHGLLHQRHHIERLKAEFTAAQTGQVQNGPDEMIHTGHGGLDEAQSFGDVLVEGAGDVSALGRLQVGESRGSAAWSTSQAVRSSRKTLQVHERRPQVVGDDVGKAPDLLVRRRQFGGALLDAHLQLVAGVPQRLLRLYPRAEIVHDAGEQAARPGASHSPPAPWGTWCHPGAGRGLHAQCR